MSIYRELSCNLEYSGDTPKAFPRIFQDTQHPFKITLNGEVTVPGTGYRYQLVPFDGFGKSPNPLSAHHMALVIQAPYASGQLIQELVVDETFNVPPSTYEVYIHVMKTYFWGVTRLLFHVDSICSQKYIIRLEDNGQRYTSYLSLSTAAHIAILNFLDREGLKDRCISLSPPANSRELTIQCTPLVVQTLDSVSMPYIKRIEK